MGTLARQTSRSARLTLTPLERTRFLIGIVMIPLAATCIFAAGVYSQRHFTERAVEVKAIYCDRERRSENTGELAASAEEAQPADQLHGGGAAPTVLPALVVVPVASLESPIFPRAAAEAPLPAGARSPLVSRGPPVHAA